jgi:hypothetical protein
MTESYSARDAEVSHRARGVEIVRPTAISARVPEMHDARGTFPLGICALARVPQA